MCESGEGERRKRLCIPTSSATWSVTDKTEAAGRPHQWQERADLPVEGGIVIVTARTSTPPPALTLRPPSPVTKPRVPVSLKLQLYPWAHRDTPIMAVINSIAETDAAEKGGGTMQATNWRALCERVLGCRWVGNSHGVTPGKGTVIPTRAVMETEGRRRDPDGNGRLSSPPA
ncbi:hypothetical protein BaRGS_00008071 [Batillaria attramentaria]|uniref:Uncharacterized protein n=1 Tax=Batillaria attramentaria TaxID=370345 RepID=A0ABD0LNB5_9CAEN